MKKTILTLAITMAAICTTNAQNTELKQMYESKSYDNWYIGANAGVATKTTHNKWLKNANANAGVRVGRWFTPAFGLEVESNAYFDNNPMASTGTIVKYLNTALGATVNLGNWWFGYTGEPRTFEVIAVPALGWGHFFGQEGKCIQNLNDMNMKLALDFAFNVDKKKSLQVYFEPALLYNLYGNSKVTPLTMTSDRSYVQFNVGIIYKFKNTNGTHNFKYAEPLVQTIIDNDEIDRLNERINDLMAENEELKNRPAKIEKIVETNDVLAFNPVVVFAQSSSYIEKKQYANIEKLANYLKSNDKATAVITGYASTEGTAKLNQKLSEARAEAVKHALIAKYGIKADRITTCAKGETADQSNTRAYNRVAVMEVK